MKNEYIHKYIKTPHGNAVQLQVHKHTTISFIGNVKGKFKVIQYRKPFPLQTHDTKSQPYLPP